MKLVLIGAVLFTVGLIATGLWAQTAGNIDNSQAGLNPTKKHSTDRRPPRTPTPHKVDGKASRGAKQVSPLVLPKKPNQPKN